MARTCPDRSRRMGCRSQAFQNWRLGARSYRVRTPSRRREELNPVSPDREIGTEATELAALLELATIVLRVGGPDAGLLIGSAVKVSTGGRSGFWMEGIDGPTNLRQSYHRHRTGQGASSALGSRMCRFGWSTVRRFRKRPTWRPPNRSRRRAHSGRDHDRPRIVGTPCIQHVKPPLTPLGRLGGSMRSHVQS